MFTAEACLCALHAEGKKAKLKASSWCAVILGVATVAGGTAFAMGKGAALMVQRGNSVGAEVFSLPDVATLFWAKAGIAALMIWAAMIVTSEVRTTLPVTWLSLPSRSLVIGAKATLAVGGVFLSTLIIVPALIWVSKIGGSLVVFDFSLLLFVLKLALGSSILAAFSVGVAALIRSLTPLLVMWGLMLITDEAVAMVEMLHPIAWFMPMSNLWHAVGVRVFETVSPPWSSVFSFVYLVGLGILALIFGGARLRRHQAF